MSTETLNERRDRVFGAGAPLFYKNPIQLVRGEDVWLFGADGRRYLDMYNNVPCVGHCHPKVVEAMSKQAATLNVHSRYLHDGVLDFAERLIGLHADPLENIVFACSGTEAVEVAVTMARAYTGKRGIICTNATYHGNSTEIRKLSGVPLAGLPADAEVRSIPFPQRYRPIEEDLTEELLAEKYVQAVDAAIAAFADGDVPFAGMIVCSLCANEGLPDIPTGFMATAAEHVRAAGGVFMADEVQAGYGRSGRWWGYEVSEFVPDIAIMGKPMGNGFPLSATVARRDIVEAFRRRGYFNTFASSPVQAAVGNAVIDVIETQGLIDSVAEVGQYLKTSIQQIAENHAKMGDVRGHGLFVGIDWVADPDTREPDRKGARVIVNQMKDKGFLFGAAGQNGNVLKLRPPLTFRREHADAFLSEFQACVEAIDAD